MGQLSGIQYPEPQECLPYFRRAKQEDVGKEEASTPSPGLDFRSTSSMSATPGPSSFRSVFSLLPLLAALAPAQCDRTEDSVVLTGN